MLILRVTKLVYLVYEKKGLHRNKVLGEEGI